MGRTAKKTLAAMIILLAWFGTGASAATNAPQTPAGPVEAGRFEGFGMDADTGGPMPGRAHAYLKCEACHIEGMAPDEICLFCHTDGGPGSQVYGGRADIYRGADPEHLVHAARHGDSAYQGCLSCHEPHGRSVIPGSALLRDDPAKYVVSRAPVDIGGGEGFGGIIAPVTNQRDFCLDCHGGVTRYGPEGRTRLSREEFQRVFAECVSCHPNGEHFGVDADSEAGGPSHVMTPEHDDTVAWKPSALPAEGVDQGSNSCTLCHDSSRDFPHSARGGLLIGGEGSARDGLCAGCHTDTGSFETAVMGVGLTF